MFYDRKIKYLDYIVDGERRGNAGFLKLVARDTVCSLTVQVSGLRQTDTFHCKVHIVGGGQEKELCGLELTQGRGAVQLTGEKLEDLGGTGISYGELEAVKIPISPEREICGVVHDRIRAARTEAARELSEEKRAGEELPGELPEGQPESGIRAETEETEAAEAAERVEKAEEELPGGLPEGQPESGIRAETEETEEAERAEKTEEELPSEPPEEESEKSRAQEADRQELQMESHEAGAARTVRTAGNAGTAQTARERKMPLQDNKWKQLWAIYPHIAPFRDDREYLSIGLNDFVILPEKYFRLAHNSFLLHGFYNYKHLVLKRLVYHGEEKIYIGVPGNFYDREKQVAVMFGFESFECQEEPADAGDYGYYLMRIEL